jgi:hypothetical protein
MSQIQTIYAPAVEKQLKEVYKDLDLHHKKLVELSKLSIDFYGGKSASNPKQFKDAVTQIEALNKKIKEQQALIEKLNASKQKIDEKTRLSEIRLQQQREKAFDKYEKQLQREEQARQRASQAQQRAAQQAERNAEREGQARLRLNIVNERANRAYNLLNENHKRASERLQDLIARGRQAGQTQREYNREIEVASRDFQRLNQRVLQADQAVGRFNRNVGNYPQLFNAARSSFMSFLSAFGLVGGIFMFASAIRNAFNSIRDFDKANTNLAATMGKNRKEIKDLTADAIKLGGATKFTASEVSSLQKELAKFGFSQKEILQSTEAILNLAAATGEDLATSATVAAQTLRGFGLDASEMGRVTDVMASSFTKSALDLSNFTESMKYVAPVAKTAGVSIEMATAMLGKLADAGVKGSMAGTSLRRILTEMAKTGLPAKEAFDAIAKSGMSLSNAMDDVGRTAQTSLLILSDTKDQVFELSDALNIAGGSAKKMADEQLQSLEGRITLMTSAWDGFIQSLNSGDGVLTKALKKAVDYSTEIVKAWQYAFANDKERNNLLITEIKTTRALELRNEVLKNVTESEKKLAETKRNLLISERQLKLDPNNKEIKEEIILLKRQEEATARLLKLQSEQVSKTASRIKKDLVEKAMLYEKEALAIAKRNREIKEQLESGEFMTVRQRQLSVREFEKNNEEITKLNNNILVHNAGIKEMNNLIKNKNTEVINENTEVINENTKSTKERVKNIYDATESEIALRIAILERQKTEANDRMNNELFDFDIRLKASEDYYKKEMQLLNEYSNLEREKIERKNAELVEKNRVARANNVLTEKEYTDNVRELDETLKNELATNELKFSQKLNEIVARRYTFIKKYDDENRRHILEATKISNDAEKFKYQQVFENENLTRKARLEAHNQYIDLIKKELQAQKIIDLAAAKTDQERLNIAAKYEQALKQLEVSTQATQAMFETMFVKLSGEITESLSITSAFVDTIFQNQINKYDALINKSNEYYDALIANAEDGSAQELALQEEKAKAEEKLQEKKRQAELKAFRFRQLASVAEIAINTAVAVSKVLAQTGVGAAALIPLIIAQGALQTATVLAQQPPAYAEGTEFHKGGDAIVGDAGKREIVQTPDGKFYETPDTTTLFKNMPRGSKVYPDADIFYRNLLKLNFKQKDESLQIEKAIEKGFKKARVNNYVSMPKIDLGHQFYKQKGL